VPIHLPTSRSECDLKVENNCTRELVILLSTLFPRNGASFRRKNMIAICGAGRFESTFWDAGVRF
jgi:hypothetical protein